MDYADIAAPEDGRTPEESPRHAAREFTSWKHISFR
jgi:hypothetical protein